MIAAALTVRAWLATLWRFAASPIGRYAMISAAVVAAGWAIHHHGYTSGIKREKAAQEAREAVARKRVAKVEAKSAEISTKTGEKLAAKKVEIRTITQTLIKEVPYAVPQDPTRGSWPIGLVRLHDAAVLGMPGLSDPAGRADAAPSGVTDAVAAPVLIANAEACRINAETVIAWRRWADDQAELWNAKVHDASKP